MANAIEETVEGLFIGYSLLDFDLKKWRSEWVSSGQRDFKEDHVNGGTAVVPLDIIVGTGGAFELKRANGLYETRHTFAIAVKNSDSERFLSNYKLFLDIADPKDGNSRSYLLVDTFHRAILAYTKSNVKGDRSLRSRMQNVG